MFINKFEASGEFVIFLFDSEEVKIRCVDLVQGKCAHNLNVFRRLLLIKSRKCN